MLAAIVENVKTGKYLNMNLAVSIYVGLEPVSEFVKDLGVPMKLAGCDIVI